MKHMISPDYKYIFDDKTGFFMRWGKNLDDDPEFSPIGPEILDYEISEICSQGCKMCFVPGTVVLTSDGICDIENLEIGDEVISFNGRGTSIDRVTYLHKNYISEDIYEIETEDGGKILVTKDHEFFTGGEWINSQNLLVGDDLYCLNGKNM